MSLSELRELGMDREAWRAAPHGVVSRQEYWSGLPCPPSGDFPDPDIEPASFMSPTLVGRFLPLGPSGKPMGIIIRSQIFSGPLKMVC